MLVELRNIGRASRGLYDTQRRLISIPVGETKKIDLADRAVDRLRIAEKKGDTLQVLTVEEEKPELSPPLTLDLDNPTAEMILANVSNIDYQQLLTAVKKIAPDVQLSQRPTKAKMLEVLREIAA